MKLVLDWDVRKARKNLTKHRVAFDEAKTVFNDPLLLTYPDDVHSEFEEGLSASAILAGNDSYWSFILSTKQKRRF